MSVFTETYYPADDTWGYYAAASTISDRLDLMDDIEQLEEGALVASLGAGAGLDIEAALYLKRPDLTVVSLDTGYRFKDVRDYVTDSREDVAHNYSPAQHQQLANARNWQVLTAADVTNLPFAEQSVDFAFSHACVPCHLEKKSAAQALREIGRVLKVGATAVLGPYFEYEQPSWFEISTNKEAVALFSEANATYTSFDHPLYGETEYAVARLVK